MAGQRIKTPATLGLSKNQSVVFDLADTMGPVPPALTPEFLSTVNRASAFLKFEPPVIVSSKSLTSQLIVDSGHTRTTGNIMSPTFPSSDQSSSDGALRNAVMAARNSVIRTMDQVNSFISRAKNAGFGPPANPFVRIAELNSQREPDGSITVTDADAGTIVDALVSYMELMIGEQQGAVDLEHNSFSAAQLASISLSFEGYGTSGNSVTDLMKFIPDLDALKQQKLAESLSVLDFRTRVPKVLYTANYSPDDQLRGALVGWRRMPDASGYVITRRSLFTDTEVSFTLTNDQLQATLTNLRDYVDMWVMGFYETISTDSTFVYLDGNIAANEYYVYSLQAYQETISDQGTVFNQQSNPYNMPLSNRTQLRQQLAQIDPVSGGTSVSPWPVISQALFGVADYDWILAGLNVRGSVNRNDARSITHQYSYVSSRLDFIFSQMDAGKFLTVSDVNSVVDSVKSSIARFGVTQVLQEVLRDTGILYQFEGTDVQDDPSFSKVGAVDSTNSNILAAIVASIDPETATLDMKTFTTNLSSVISAQAVSAVSSATSSSQVGSFPTEVKVPDPSDSPEHETQFIADVGDESHLDLTTFDGISKLVRTIRIVSDAGASRGALLVSGVQKFGSSVLKVKSED